MSSSKNLTGAETIRWELSDLFMSPDDPAIDSSINHCKELSFQFNKKYRGQVISLSEFELESAYNDIITIYEKMVSTSQYAGLLLSTNTSDDVAKQLQSKVEVAFSEISNNLVFFDLELGKLPSEKLESIKSNPSLQKYLYIITRTCDLAKYQLSEGEEKAITMKDITGKSAFKNLYGELASSFIFDFAINGEIKQYSGDELRALRYHPDPDVRQRAMKLFFSKYEEQKIIFTKIFNSIIKDFTISKNLRGYSSPVNVRNT
ncbi:MAG: hypothetical protein ACE5D7_03600, partial [Fidelibacterota bacterium]